MIKRMWFIIGVLLLLVPALFYGGQKPTAIPKDTLVMANNTEIFITFDPGVCFEVLPSALLYNVYARLVNIEFKDGKFVPIPDIAESWEVANDGKTWTFHLRKGVVFDNGDPLKADAVVYSFQRAIKLQKSPAWLFTDVLGLTEESVTAVDDATVQIVTKGSPANEVLTVFAHSIGGILNPKVVKEHEVDGDMGQAWLTDHSAGAGPYTLKEWKRKIQLVLAANKNYWRGEPSLKTVMIQDIPEPTDRLLALQKGDIDVAWALTAEQAHSLKDVSGVGLITTPAQTLEYVAMNSDWGPLKDKRVRQAVKYAIDYKAIIEKVREGFAIENQQFLPVGYFGYVENNPYSRDVEKAKMLMAEAGYADGFEVELVTNENDIRRQEAVVVQSNLADIGIKAEIVIMQASQMYAKYRQQGLQMIVAGWGVDYPDPNALANPFANYRVKQLAWRNVWYDDHAADLVEASSTEKDEKKRLQMYKALMDYWHENGPFAMLHQRIQYWGVRNEIKGYDKATEGYSVRFDLTKISK